jgi:serine/threonine protein kinase
MSIDNTSHPNLRYTIFINYRRNDCSGQAALLYNHLTSVFGEGSVFYDITSIPSGAVFENKMLGAIRETAAVVISLIGRKWLRVHDESGRRRIDHPEDYVRREIEVALEYGKEIIPTLVDNFNPPKDWNLAEKLQPLLKRSFASLRSGHDLKNDLERLSNSVREILRTRGLLTEAVEPPEHPKPQTPEPSKPKIPEPQPTPSLEPQYSKPKDVSESNPDSAKAVVTGVVLEVGAFPIAGSPLMLRKKLGSGGFGEVWLAEDPQRPKESRVALKFCLEPEALPFLKNEAVMVCKALGNQKHSGIVNLLSTHLDNDPPALAYEYIQGGTLSDWVRATAPGQGHLPIDSVAKIVRRIASVLSHTHRLNPPIVHRDLKPANILVERRDNSAILRVADFGIGGTASRSSIESTKRGESKAEQAIAIGAHSILYASPEQKAGRLPDPRDDVHALGVIWYQLLTGDLTCSAPTGSRWIDSLRSRGMPKDAIELLAACVEARASDRPANGDVVCKKLDQLLKPEARRIDQPQESTSAPQSPKNQENSLSSSSLELPELVLEIDETKPPTRTKPGTNREPHTTAYPRFDEHNNTLLKCECGHILKQKTLVPGEYLKCPSCRKLVQVPEWWNPLPVTGSKVNWDGILHKSGQGQSDRNRRSPKKKSGTNGNWLVGGIVAIAVIAVVMFILGIKLLIGISGNGNSFIK